MKEYSFIEGLDYVDLGLPSRTLWATCNLGADSPEDFGDYYAWGETIGYNSGKVTFTWDTYKWCVNSKPNFISKLLKLQPPTLRQIIKYSKEVDSLSELERWDDAAYENRSLFYTGGCDWCMPSVAQFDELCKNCTWMMTSYNNVFGCEVIGPNENSIFLPGTGSYRDARLESDFVYLWSRSLVTENSELAYCLFWDSGSMHLEKFPRFYGHCIRPVLNRQKWHRNFDGTSVNSIDGTSVNSVTVPPSIY